MLGCAILLFFWTASPYVRLKAPLGFAILFPRLTAGALCGFLFVANLAGVLLAWQLGAPPALALFALAAIAALLLVRRIVAIQGDFGAAFGPQWEERITPAQRTGMLRRRWRWQLPAPQAVQWQRDVPFWTLPDTDRTLLCDIWQPPAGTAPSGLAYIYFHGSAWYIMDKDAWTRRLFAHLAAQGHVVMDVAYRLYPETDIPGMIGDAKRAVAWLKAHAAEYGVRPDRIVVGGSSAGGHMAQMVGYAPDHPDLTPPDVQGADLTVRGVVSVYGPSDLAVCFAHTSQDRMPGVGATPPDLQLLSAPAPALFRLLGKDAARHLLHRAPVAGRLDWLMGGTPQQVPERYAVCSPINHVHPGCPPTLLIQGQDDLITSAAATRQLYARLRAMGVPAINIIYPHTDHGFDLALLGSSPAAQGALYALERFLAVLAGDDPAVQPELAAG